MKRLALLLLALVLLAPAAGAVEVWEKELGSEITAVATDEMGGRIYVATADGIVRCFDVNGDLIGDIIQHETTRISNLILSRDGKQLAIQHYEAGRTSSVYLIDTETGDDWFSISNRNYQFGVAAKPDGSVWYILAHESTDTTKDYLAVVTPERGAWFIVPDLLPETFTVAGDGTWAVGAEGAAPTKADLLPLSELPPLREFPPLNELPPYPWRTNHPPLSELPPLSEFPPLELGQIFQLIKYSASNSATFDIVIHRSTGTAYEEVVGPLRIWHIYVGDQCKSDYGDIRFYDGNLNELDYYLHPDYTSSSARFTVLRTGADSTGTLWVAYHNPKATTTSNETVAGYPPIYNNFEDQTVQGWNALSDGTTLTVVQSDGSYRLQIEKTYTGSWQTGYCNGYLDLTLPAGNYQISLWVWTARHYQSDQYDTFYRIEYGSTVLQDYTRAAQDGETVTYTITSDGTPTKLWVRGKSYGNTNTATVRIDNVQVIPANHAPPSLQSVTPISFVGLHPSATKTYTGTIQRIDAPTTGNWFAVSTTSNLYLQQVTSPTALGTTITAARVGAPYDLVLSNDASFCVEGRNNLIDIFRADGAQVGTYTAGSAVRHVAIAQVNGLYAAAGSDDGKYYVFSKDASSSWYLLHASDSASPVTALAMSWRGETIVVGRSDGHLVAFRPAVEEEEEEEEEFPGTIRFLVYKDALPYKGARLVIEHGGTDQTWETATAITTDDYGVATAQVRWGEYVRVTVGENELQRVILPNPQQTEYVFRIKGPDPLRTGAQYSSDYDPDTRRIYLYYDDTRGNTHYVQYKIIRSVDGAVVFYRTYSTFPVNDYYQIPAGWTNTSYRIQLTASGSPSFTNTWSQWVGTDGVASLPADLDTYARMGIAFFLILFVAGLFSYLSGPQGAVVVSLFAGALVLWGWLPLPPTVIALCIVWAFLGLLGRTSGE